MELLAGRDENLDVSFLGVGVCEGTGFNGQEVL
jgi:hypothetical protein